MNVKTRAMFALSTGLLLLGLVACGGSDSGDTASDAGNAQSAQGADTPAEAGAADGGAEDGGAEEAEGKDPVEKPLTGEAKQKAEAAALAAFPGTVIKSEEDAENPGTYAVEVKKSDGTEVEVYLDPKTYKVLKTKNEDGDEDGN